MKGLAADIRHRVSLYKNGQKAHRTIEGDQISKGKSHCVSGQQFKGERLESSYHLDSAAISKTIERDSEIAELYLLTVTKGEARSKSRERAI